MPGSAATRTAAAPLLIAAVLLGAQGARALELRVEPFLSVSSAPGATRITLLGPLFEWRREGPRTRLALRPLLWWGRRPGPQGTELALLYPLAVLRWDADRLTARVAGLLSWSRAGGSGAGGTRPRRQGALFPFLFYRDGPGGRSLAVLPLFADLRGFLGFRRVRALAFPLFLAVDEGARERLWLPFPFAYRIRGPLGSGWGLWPLFGWKEAAGAERSRFLLWPLFAERVRYPGNRGEVRSRVIGPWWQVDGPAVRSRAWAGPFFVHTTDRARRRETFGFPWPLWTLQRDLDTGAITSLRLWPFYQDRRQGPMRSRFWLWPLYRHRTWREGEARRERRDLLLALGRRIDEDCPAGHRRWLTLFPLLRAQRTGAGEEQAAPALLDALVPRNRLVREVWAPLWSVWTWRRPRDRPAQWSLFWGLLSGEGGRLRPPVTFSRSAPAAHAGR